MYLFFSSTEVQTKFAQSLTQRINKAFDTSIAITGAKLSLQGELELSSLLISDHQQDTLLYAQSITTRLDEFDRIFDRTYVFSQLTIDRPLLRITTYPGEKKSNLQQFLGKLVSEKTASSPTRGSVDVLTLVGGQVEIKKPEQPTQLFTSLALRLNDLSFSKDVLSTRIATSTVDHSALSHPLQLTGDIRISNHQIHAGQVSARSKDAYFKGNLTVDLAKEEKDTQFNVQIVDGNVPFYLFPQIGSFATTEQAFSVQGKWLGTLNRSTADLQLQFSSSTSVAAKLVFQQTPAKQWKIYSEQFEANLFRSDLMDLPILSKNQERWWNQMAWQSMGVRAQFDYTLAQELNADLAFSLPETDISTRFSLQKKGEDWNLTQDFSVLGNPSAIFPESGLNALEGEGNLEATIHNSQLIAHQWAIDLPQVEWKKTPFNKIYLNGNKDRRGENFSLEMQDPKAQLSIVAHRKNQPSHPFTLHSQIEAIHLSALGITPENADVKLSATVDFRGDNNLLSHIKVNQLHIKNRFENKAFSNFLIAIETNPDGKRIFQSGSDFFDVAVQGKFKFANLNAIVGASLQESFLWPPVAPLAVDESFVFDFTIEETILKALYPSIASPEKIRLHGEMSSLPGKTQFSLDLPFLRYKNYTFESLTWVTATQFNTPVTQFSVKRMYSDQLALYDLKLITKHNKEAFGGSMSGSFGRDKRAFTVDFDFGVESDQSLINLNHVEWNTAATQWRIASGVKPQVVLDHHTNAFQVKNLNLTAENQSIAANVSYQAANEFSLELNTINLNLGDVLPLGTKFDIDGRLNTSIGFAVGNTDTQAAATLGIDQLTINQVAMGDFDLSLTGSPQFNTYQVSTQLVEEGETSLQGQGNIYLPAQSVPNVDIDFKLNAFDLSFLSKLGKEAVKNVTGVLTSELNLWGAINDLKLSGNGSLDKGYLYFPALNTGYEIAKNTAVQFRDNSINFNGARLIEPKTLTRGQLKGGLRHLNFNAWEMDLAITSDRLMVYNRENNPDQLFYGQGFLNGKAHFMGPTKSLTLQVEGSSSEGTSLIIPWQENKGLSDTTFIDFFTKNGEQGNEVEEQFTRVDEEFRGFEMIFDLDLNRNAELEIVVDQDSGSTLSGRGAGNILIETNTAGKFNMWGDFITYEGIYNFRNLGLIDKKFVVKQGGTIVWEGDPIGAQMNLEATYQVPGGANPALLLDNPNFNRKIPTNVEIQLAGNLLKPDDPIFDITFPNTTGIVASEINYRLADQQRRQTQAISLLSQGIFISDVSVSLQGITNNLYEKASDVFSSILGTNEGKLNVGLNYLQGEENPTFDLRTEDRIGLTISTQISDRILFNGKIGVPIDGVDETVIVGDVQIDFILNENGNLRAKVFNRENEFRYLGDELGYTQGLGMSYQVDFNTFQELIQKIVSSNPQKKSSTDQSITAAIDYRNKSK